MVESVPLRQVRYRYQGFNLTELMVAVAIAGVLAAIAVPSFRTLDYTSKRSTVVNDLVAALQYARGEAIKRGRQVVVCPGTTSCGGDTDWASGWIAFQNTDRDDPPVIDTAEPVLKRGGGAPAKVTITTSADSFAYEPFNNRMGDGGTLVVCTPLGATEARAVIVSSGTRRARSSATDSGGGALTCP